MVRSGVILAKYRNVAVLSLGTFAVVLGLGASKLVLFFYLLSIFGTVEAAHGYLGTLIYIVVLAAIVSLMPVLGWVSDRYGRKKLIVLAFFAYFLASFLYPITLVLPLVYFIFISRFLSSVYDPAYNALLADSVEARRRGSVFGATEAILSIVPFAATAMSSALFYAWSYAGVFYVSATVILSGAVLCLVFLAEPAGIRATIAGHPWEDGSRGKNAGSRDLEQASLKEDARNVNHVLGLSKKGNWRVTISLIAINILFPFVLIQIRSVFGWVAIIYDSFGLISSVDVWLALLGIFSLVLGGVLADSRGRKKALQDVLKLGIGLSLVVFLAFWGSYLWLSVALMSIIAFLSGAVLPLSYALISDITPSSRRGMTFGFVLLGIGVGDMALTLLSVAPYPPLGELEGVRILCALSFVVIIAAAILSIWGVEEPAAAY